jgi:hypothetical protein
MLSLMFSDSRVGPHRRLRAARVLGPSIGARTALAGLAAIDSRKPYLRGLRAMRINRKVEKSRVGAGCRAIGRASGATAGVAARRDCGKDRGKEIAY